ncbi:hypothetical protein CRUP_008036 [Coryphaenoides rupestris]|nr:hypothetical protein CRUP_008036 [Coryphaenoides rupestris]
MGPQSLGWTVAAAAAALLGVILTGTQETSAFPAWRSEEEVYSGGVLLIGIRRDTRPRVLLLSRNKRYTLTPEQLKWEQFKLSYKLLSFPSNLINASDTRRGIARAFGLWSDVSPFTFREVPADQDADIKIDGPSILEDEEEEEREEEEEEEEEKHHKSQVKAVT